MKNLHKRLNTVENKLNLKKDPIVVKILCYGDEELPANQTIGNIDVHFVTDEEH